VVHDQRDMGSCQYDRFLGMGPCNCRIHLEGLPHHRNIQRETCNPLGMQRHTVLLPVGAEYGANMRKVYVLLIILVGFFQLTGCVTSEPLAWRDYGINAVWPPPPNPPRVRYLRDLKGPDDVLPQKGNITRFIEFVTGEDGTKIEFISPYGVASNGKSVVYVTDVAAGLVHKYDLATRTVSYLSQVGEERLVRPAGVVVDREENVYVTDAGQAKVYKFDRNGTYLFALAGTFQRPAGIAINSRGEKFIVDVLAHKLKVYDVQDKFVRDFPQEDSRISLNLPSNVAIDRNDDVYVTDSMNFKVKVFDHAGNYKYSIGEIGDAPGSFARPKGIAVDGDGHIYIIDASHENFQIFNREGKLLLFVGRSGTGPGEFSLPSGIHIDAQNRIFVADTYNRRIQIFQYETEGGTR